MASIRQHELRDDLARVLRRAEAGECIVVTVSGREVAELGPVQGGRFVAAGKARAVFAGLPATKGLMQDLHEAAGDAVDPWAPRPKPAPA
ncbi:MAG: type II toxin-antitoxin system prevent-host-death family antitoxin [Solirubrobacteraceae bacterium]|nr:type II toxin-antitoxin system prevent-host-death family antitoxin [Solirubrobacteraceae bacterium]